MTALRVYCRRREVPEERGPVLGLLLNMIEAVVELRKAESPVDLRSGELETVFREQNTLFPVSISAILIADADALFFQLLLQPFPSGASGQTPFDRIIDFVSGLVGFAQPLPPYVVLSRREIQSVLLGQLPADLGVSNLDVLVRNGLSVISDPVVDQMTVRMGLVEMANQ